MAEVKNDDNDYDVRALNDPTKAEKMEIEGIKADMEYERSLTPEQRQEYFATKEKVAKGIPLESEAPDENLEEISNKARQDCYDED